MMQLKVASSKLFPGDGVVEENESLMTSDEVVAKPSSSPAGTTEGGQNIYMDGSFGRPQRWQALLGLLSDRGQLTVAGASEALSVSPATIRRDFTALAAQQLVTRTHGGVVATAGAYDLPVQYRDGDVSRAKQQVATTASRLVPACSVVALNGGTTTSATARQLGLRSDLADRADRPALTVVTNALNIATELVLRPHIRTVTLGGVARPNSYEQVGPLAKLVLQELWIDVLILGVDGLTLRGGVSAHHDGEAEINSAMVKRAERVVVVATSEKMGHRSLVRVCDWSQIDTLVTDSGVDDAFARELRSWEVDVIVATSNSP
ncbi:DeoR/GlpR family DNA-binding transcription regulator [Arthrobacter castelli]|uniref:DeoR/GlpR family DNA-binding transcription regulator n=1 Tax=Arthrobacter castelli TaxID=271431 RepID=UPI001FDF547B|nr:DeoR/GlpR family DNA-binding transcription regulator [Arthrobacter castelli]